MPLHLINFQSGGSTIENACNFLLLSVAGLGIALVAPVVVSLVRASLSKSHPAQARDLNQLQAAVNAWCLNNGRSPPSLDGIEALAAIRKRYPDTPDEKVAVFLSKGKHLDEAEQLIFWLNDRIASDLTNRAPQPHFDFEDDVLIDTDGDGYFERIGINGKRFVLQGSRVLQRKLANKR